MPRVGVRNPHRMTNAAWTWLARRSDLSAYQANAIFGGPSSLAVGPCWCGSRFGQSETTLPDGRIVRVGGEHEDYYDSDFYIYNDVIVQDPAGGLEIYGYPLDVLPPTDFHSATLVGERIVLVGCLGHPAQRDPSVTPVYALDTGSLAVTRLQTAGDAPGWLFKHEAELAPDGATLTVRGGHRHVLRDGEAQILDNFDDWSLDLGRALWTRLTDRRWPQWELSRESGRSNRLFDLEMASWHAEYPSDFGSERLAELERELGGPPDLALHAIRYAPPLEHTQLPAPDDEPRDVLLSIDGVTVRYREDSFSVRLTVKGELPPETVERLVEDARSKLAALERTPYVARRLDV